jgi:hypothetical protein
MPDTLSPAAQAVLNAYIQGLATKRLSRLAAALRAAADQLSYGHGSWKGPSAIINEDELLAIAAELEGQPFNQADFNYQCYVEDYK